MSLVITIIIYFIGNLSGFVIAALCQAAKRNDLEVENNGKLNME